MKALRTDILRITFGIIVLNGEPFTRYTLRALYPFAHEIIVVEGAVPDASNVSTHDGHSIDGTLDILYNFKKDEDYKDKLRIVTKEGFWSEKDEQSQAYANLATGDYLWQVDIDEYYLPEDMQKIIQMLKSDPTITGMSFKTITFFGNISHIVDGFYLKTGAEIYRRLFKWQEGFKYQSHRPPTVLDATGNDLSLKNWINGHDLQKQEIYLFHFSLLFPVQVENKAIYYANSKPYDYDPIEWYRKSYLKLKWPFRYHNVYLYRSWIEKYNGKIPKSVIQMMKDIREGDVNAEIRDSGDIENLLKSRTYLVKRLFWKVVCNVALMKLSVKRYFKIAKNFFGK
ncbi:MAG: glycosyltransferase family 2 protein [Deltaproteobacteria bacterium]|nr:glycosyltransferase family 2 protein [Deltaproteobacteria bacterium]